jgi:hypothetical protein
LLPDWMKPVGQERGDIPKASGIEVKCPKCGHRRLDEVFSRSVNSSTGDRTGFQCPACKYLYLSESKAPESKISILPLASPTHGRWVTEKEPAPDETQSADRKSFWQKITKSDNERPAMYTKTTRNGKTQYVGYCSQCDRQRTSFSPQCPSCKTTLE